MARKKVELKWIERDSARRASLRKRREGLVKKMNELTTLCGIEGCAVIISPGDDEPMHWPPTREGVEQVMDRLLRLPEFEQCKKMTTLESYLDQKVAKLHETLMKQQRKRREMEMNHVMHQIFDHGRGMGELNLNELDGLSWFMGEKGKEIKSKIHFLRQTAPGTSGANEAGAGPTGGGHGVEGKASMEGVLWGQWLNMGILSPNENVGSSSSGGGGYNMEGPDLNIGGSSNGGDDMGMP